MKMSKDALEMMQHLTEQYIEGKFPPHPTWCFSPPPGGDEVFAELRALGLIKMLGTASGKNFVLTDAGKDWVLENQP